jgi:hypothetical protein
VTNSGEAALVVTTHDNGAEVEVHALRDGRFSVRAPNRRPVVVDEPATALLAAENALEREAV